MADAGQEDCVVLYVGRAGVRRQREKLSARPAGYLSITFWAVQDEQHVTGPRSVYDESADRYVEFVGTEIGPATEGVVDRSLLTAFGELVAERGGSRVADLGCGPGRAAAFLARQRFDVVGIDVSGKLLDIARRAHPHIRFEIGCLDDLPFETGALGGAVSWYSIIYTPPGRLDAAFGEIARVLEPGGLVLLAFQAGEGDKVHTTNAHGTGLPLTSYRHDVDDVARRLETIGFDLHVTAVRVPELPHETTPQAFVIARCR